MNQNLGTHRNTIENRKKQNLANNPITGQMKRKINQHKEILSYLSQ